jgi:hypothetical protein
MFVKNLFQFFLKLAGSKLTKKSITGKVDCSTFFPIMMLKNCFKLFQKLLIYLYSLEYFDVFRKNTQLNTFYAKEKVALVCKWLK